MNNILSSKLQLFEINGIKLKSYAMDILYAIFKSSKNLVI